MNKARESFINKVVWPLLLVALTPPTILIGSKIQAGDWLTWINTIPSWAYTCFFSFVGFWVIGGWIVRRIRALKERNSPPLPLLFSVPRWGYTTVGTLSYKNVVWRVRIPAHAPWETLTKLEARRSRVDIETPPHCQKCDTELEESETFFGRYKWTCIRCGFSSKNESNFYREAVRAEKLAQSWRENNQGD